MTVTVYNSNDKVLRKIKKASYELLDRIKGKKGWYAIAEYDDGDKDVLHYVNGDWINYEW